MNSRRGKLLHALSEVLLGCSVLWFAATQRSLENCSGFPSQKLQNLLTNVFKTLRFNVTVVLILCTCGNHIKNLPQLIIKLLSGSGNGVVSLFFSVRFQRRPKGWNEKRLLCFFASSVEASQGCKRARTLKYLSLYWRGFAVVMNGQIRLLWKSNQLLFRAALIQLIEYLKYICAVWTLIDLWLWLVKFNVLLEEWKVMGRKLTLVMYVV